MKFLATILLLASSTLLAQDYPRLELSAGYSYGTVDTQGYGSNNAQGWSGSVAANLKRWIGVEGEVSSRFQTFDFNLSGTALQVNSRYYSVLGGPRFAHRAGKLTPFVHALFGLNRGLDYGATVVDPVTGASVTPYVNGIAAVPGGGFDYAVNRHVSLRTQADYFFTRQPTLGTSSANNFRVMAGIVFTFGQREEPAYAKNKREQTTIANAAVPPAQALVLKSKDPANSVAEPIAPVVTQDLAASAPLPAVTQPARVPTLAVPESPTMPVSSSSSAPASPVLTASVRAPEMKPSIAKVPAPTPAAPIAASQTMVAGSMSDKNTVIISQAPAQWQSGPKQEESLGDVARRYRAKKMQGMASNGL